MSSYDSHNSPAQEAVHSTYVTHACRVPGWCGAQSEQLSMAARMLCMVGFHNLARAAQFVSQNRKHSHSHSFHLDMELAKPRYDNKQNLFWDPKNKPV